MLLRFRNYNAAICAIKSSIFMPCTIAASSRDSPCAEGHPRQCIPAFIRIGATSGFVLKISPIVISFGVLLAGGIFFVVTMFVRQNYAARKNVCIYVSILTAFFLGVLLLFQGHSDIRAELRPKENVTGVYLAQNSSSDMVRWVFVEYYLADKNLMIAENAADFKSAYVFREAIPPERVEYGNKAEITRDIYDEISGFPAFTDENTRMRTVPKTHHIAAPTGILMNMASSRYFPPQKGSVIPAPMMNNSSMHKICLQFLCGAASAISPSAL